MASAEKLAPLALSQNSTATYQDWLAWKRSLIYYLEAKDITDPQRKKAVLMHQGGRELQEIFATIESSDPTAVKDAKDPFEFAMAALDKHFKPTTNKCYERFLFRQIRQNDDSLEQFVVKLRKQAANCSFHNQNEAIVDQIIDGTSDPSFRHKILEQRLDKLPAVIELGKLLEAVKIQTSSMSGESSGSVESIARLQTNRARRGVDNNPGQSGSIRRCFRCGSSEHIGNDANCPAKDSTCFKCQRVGHFANRCRSRTLATSVSATPELSAKTLPSTSSMDRSTNAELGKSAKSKVRMLERVLSSSSDEDANCFALSSSAPDLGEFSNRVPLRFGSVWVSPIIDSGADPNVLAPQLWHRLKKAGIQYTKSTVDTRVYPYGKKEPLKIQSAVEFHVHSRSKTVKAKFLIVADDEGDYDTFVGRILGVRLGILRIGEETSVNHLCIEAAESSKTGKLTDVLLKVPLDPSVSPVAQPCRRVPFALRKKIREHTSELTTDGIIEEVKDEPTTWVSPIVPVIKKNGSLRLCIDMRQANKAVLREKFPIPTFEELLADMTDCTVFSKIDLRSAYNQVELDPQSRKITTFITPDGIFRFKRLYCGIKCAPEMFQRIMTSVIAGLENVRVFFDDIIVFSKNRSDHERHVNALLQRLKSRGLTINLDKSSFGVDEVEFLGHRLSKNRIRPNVTNEEAVRNFEPPTNKKDLQSFLGLMNYVSRFIPDYSSLTAPLRHLLGKNVVFRWSKIHSATFEKLKAAVVNVKLAIFDPNATILIYSDASPVALGAVLMQRRTSTDQPEILAFASRSLSKPEQNYSQIEREALGLIWACERFRLYTLGKNFELYTDHKPLEILFSPKSKPNARIERWVLRLQNFDYTIKYVQGPKNLADPFSRLGYQKPSRHSYTPNIRSTVRSLAVLAVPKAISLEEFRSESEKDAEINSVVKALRENTQLPESFLKVRFELTFVDNLLLRGDRLVPPASLRPRILSQAHEGHPGIEVMKRRLRTKVWWPKIDTEASKFVKSCRSCLAVSQVDPPEPMQRSALPQRPWEYVAIDHLGPLPDGKYLLLVVDYFSRFVEFQFVSSMSSADTIGCLYQIFARFGFPTRLKSDNATVFLSGDFKNFLAEYGVDHITSPPLWPRANGEVERQNRSILKRLKIAALEKRNLQVELAKYILLYHGTPHSSTGAAPAELMLQRKIRDKLPSLANPSPLYDDIRDADSESKTLGKSLAETRRRLTGPKRNLEVGDRVLVQAKKTNKLSPTFDPDPFTIVETKPGEVTIRRRHQVLRRSTSAVKPLSRTSLSAGESSPLESPSDEQPSLSAIPSSPVCRAPSPPGSPFKGFAESQNKTQLELSHGLSTTRSGRVISPPTRLDL